MGRSKAHGRRLTLPANKVLVAGRFSCVLPPRVDRLGHTASGLVAVLVLVLGEAPRPRPGEATVEV